MEIDHPIDHQTFYLVDLDVCCELDHETQNEVDHEMYHGVDHEMGCEIHHEVREIDYHTR